ncbi:MAG: hypothetical protein KDA90_06300 [Planctomycetaceae bacterium]|nr:hypothetical protein [Planctomycetaceae bacterium]
MIRQLARVGLTWGFLLFALGCHTPQWMRRETCVLEPGVSKSELVGYLNQNITGTQTRGGLASWRTSNARTSITGIPVSLPTSIAVEAPRSFRLRVSHPMSGGQEADIGSNDERFWMWSKDMPQIMTASHEDVGLAMNYLELPVPIQPDWLMEVFGVIPLNEQEFQLSRPDPMAPIVELVANRTTPQGETVQRIIRVNTCRGQITEHLLRRGDGHLIARAVMENYRLHETGISMPGLVRLQWPDAKVEMRLDLGRPEVNPSSLASNKALWEIPIIPNVSVVDIGEIARRRAGIPSSVAQVGHEWREGAAGVATIPSADANTDTSRPAPPFGNPWGNTDPAFTEPPRRRDALADSLSAPQPDPSLRVQPASNAVRTASPDAPVWAQ